ncbi:MAG TPA: hypothetical protein IAA66_04905 [Candidatus Avichristensenella intestinipullorum]|uniref:DUF6259 domain-containing protein n=1 Tax=Candidatus Avichristensenella intestinipullorum TaxID=2840693 RepID=A0A9D0YVM1_9FIRM|nr:hypothetical protein [Candidatus Avichristensenella intestinipullorum]
MPDQIRVSNGRLSIGLSRRTGAWVELVCEATGENLVKNRRDAAMTPLQVFLGHRAEPVGPSEADAPAWDMDTDGLTLTCRYSCLYAGGERLPVSAQVTYALDARLPRVTVRARVEAARGVSLSSVRFPCLAGVWLGADGRDNVLITPFQGGERIENPSQTLAATPPRIAWQWQDYHMRYALGGPCGEPDGKGRWIRSAAVSGGCSALFCDIYGARGGMYFACDDEACGVRSLLVGTRGPDCPGVLFAFDHPARGEVWESPPCTVALHDGDWRDAVDAWRGARQDAPQSPGWFQKSAGLVAHYDFQYQSGEVVHRFAELPGLYDLARAQGLTHIMLAGWHEDGFDRGFPRYRPNALLGGEDALREAVGAVRRAGGHVTFYVNARLCNTAYPAFSQLREAAAERDGAGRPLEERYGSQGLTFACMCPQAKAWRDVIVDAARYLTGRIGAGGLYLDQLAAAPPALCHGGHGDFDGWNRGCRQLLREVRQAVGPDVAILVQGVAESVGGLCDGMLTGSLSSLDAGGFPAFYRYLHPEQTLLEMMNPRKFSAMRPEPVARRSSEIMDRAFLLGAQAWVYDLEGDNTFRLDPPQHERLRRMLALRRAWLSAYGQGRYRDAAGVSAPGLRAARYELAGGEALIAFVNGTGAPAWARVEYPFAARAFVRTDSAPEQAVEMACTRRAGALWLEIPGDTLSLVHILREGSGEGR